jgi:hypothetical protein
VRISGYRVKLPGLEADRPSLSSAEIKKEWSYNSSPSIQLRGVSRDNVTFCTCDRYWSGLGDNTGMGLIEIQWEGVGAFVNTVMNMQVHEVTGFIHDLKSFSDALEGLCCIPLVS